MIYLHYGALGKIDKAVQKERLIAYRQRCLADFCTKKQLPSPILYRHHHGKPLCQNVPELAFNHSHSQKHYALTYGLDVADLGVDIESLDRQVRVADLARRYFHADEWAYWQAQGGHRTTWLMIWTIKEALLKAHGLGIRLDLKCLNTKINDRHCGVVSHTILGEFYYQSFVFDECVATIAYRWRGVVYDVACCDWLNVSLD